MWSRSYGYHYQGCRRRSLRSRNGFGTRPCFPKTLAVCGHRNASMALLRTCPPQDAGFLGNRWEGILGPCGNAGTLYAGLHHIDWVLRGTIDSNASGALTNLAHAIVSTLNPKYSPAQLLTIPTGSKCRLKGRLFDALLRQVEGTCRRLHGLRIGQPLLIHSPSYNLKNITSIMLYT